jgi:hypothetical protein
MDVNIFLVEFLFLVWDDDTIKILECSYDNEFLVKL